MGKKIKSERRYELDWLRILAIILLFFYHSAKVFDTADFHINNGERDFGLTIFVGIVTAFIMPLFFLLSGMSIFYSLRKREAGVFAKERIKRIIIPFIFGILFLLSIHSYFEAVHKWGVTSNFFEYYIFRYFWLDLLRALTYFGYYLWYLLILFIFSIIGLPIFLYYRKEENHEKIEKLANFLKKPGAILLLGIPLVLSELITYALGLASAYYGGWQFASYFIIVIYGFLFASDEQFREIMEKNVVICAIVALISTPLIGIMYAAGIIILVHVFVAIAGIAWLTLIIGLASKYLNKKHDKLNFLNENVLPFYILHQTIIVAIAFFIIGMEGIVIVKYLLLVAIAFPITLGLVLLVRTNNVTRYLFGMRLKKKEVKLKE
ncbi:MAG: acyltransferase family protein [Promethearchaeota archaeon]